MSDWRTWERGWGVIRHRGETRKRIAALAPKLAGAGDGVPLDRLLAALDRICCAAMWLVVHQTYARRVYLDGRRLEPDDFKPRPEGHTGGALNMVPAYAGYLAANAATGITRSWLMGQGHCVAAIDALNVLVNNTSPAHGERYPVTDEGLTRYVNDFYSYRLTREGTPESPLGSHVNAHTAGGLAEGGYLGFAELQYVHMPLRGERLTVFLSDGAFEEQRGSDWAPRWWRAEDSGLVTPIMIKNGRRIDQRTTMAQQGGTDWFRRHLRLNGFDPFVFDGRDPAAFVWAILEAEDRLEREASELAAGKRRYPVRLPYGIATAPKGAGFPGEGTNLAHNLPLLANPHYDRDAANRFNEAAKRLWTPPGELREALALFQRHERANRPRERNHALVDRNPDITGLDELPARPVARGERSDPAAWPLASPMDAVDGVFTAVVRRNPHLRPRVGNPDEMRSNRLSGALEALRFRVTDPEPGVPESLQGAVITALNEEAVVCAALANKGGVNLVHTYEAFGPKMHGAIRQEIIFAKNLAHAGRPPKWISTPVILTSHTWENGKNEHSHQDPSLAEAMLGEPAPFSRVLFPADFNTAAAVMSAVFETRGQIWTIVVPKAETIPVWFEPAEAKALTASGAIEAAWAGHRREHARLVLGAVGAYQFAEVLRASRRLTERQYAHSVVYLMEPARAAVLRQVIPAGADAVFVSHTRPHVLRGMISDETGAGSLQVLGYRNEGGTLDTPGMLMVNGCTWAHCLRAAARAAGVDEREWLTAEEAAAISGESNPQGVIIPAPGTGGR